MWHIVDGYLYDLSFGTSAENQYISETSLIALQ